MTSVQATTLSVGGIPLADGTICGGGPHGIVHENKAAHLASVAFEHLQFLAGLDLIRSDVVVTGGHVRSGSIDLEKVGKTRELDYLVAFGVLATTKLLARGHRPQTHGLIAAGGNQHLVIVGVQCQHPVLMSFDLFDALAAQRPAAKGLIRTAGKQILSAENHGGDRVRVSLEGQGRLDGALTPAIRPSITRKGSIHLPQAHCIVGAGCEQCTGLSHQHRGNPFLMARQCGTNTLLAQRPHRDLVVGTQHHQR
mmetsp:Transcript_45567/g.114664  ORF Transcript_45567/g.114664 Transcript_45567/m.114664 type:complete len:253 (-) Transcript_45567:243-1001(-)